MNTELQSSAIQILNENSDIYAPVAEALPKTSVRDYFFALKKNIDEFLKRDKELIGRLKTIDKAVEEKAVKRNVRELLKLKREEIERVRDKMHSQLISWWEEYDAKCPISVKIALTPIGETVCFGYYKSFKDGFNDLVGKIEWRVLAKKNGVAYLISERILDIVPYSSLSLESWHTSVLRKWCQDLYAKGFTDVEKMFIVPVNLRTPEIADGVSCLERVFIPCATDIERYMPTERDRYTQATDVAASKVSMTWGSWKGDVPANRRVSGWWTRTSMPNTKDATCVIDRISTVNVENLHGVSANESRKIYSKAYKAWPMGVRPAVLVKVAE